MADQSAPELSIVIPVFDEGETVQKVYDGVRETFGKDCEIISDLLDGDPALRLIAFHRNHGKSEALGVGFRRARGRLVATLDGDLQDDPGSFPAWLRKLTRVTISWSAGGAGERMTSSRFMGPGSSIPLQAGWAECACTT